MTRTDFWLALAFFTSLAVAIAIAFGNPLRLEGSKLQEFLGYIVGLLLASAVLLATVNLAVFRRSGQEGDRETTSTEAR